MQADKRKIDESAAQEPLEKKVKLEGGDVPLITPARTPSPERETVAESNQSNGEKVAVKQEMDVDEKQEMGKGEEIKVKSNEAETGETVEVKQESLKEETKEEQHKKSDKLPKRYQETRGCPDGLLRYRLPGNANVRLHSASSLAHSLVTLVQRRLKRRSTKPSRLQVS